GAGAIGPVLDRFPTTAYLTVTCFMTSSVMTSVWLSLAQSRPPVKKVDIIQESRLGPKKDRPVSPDGQRLREIVWTVGCEPANAGGCRLGASVLSQPKPRLPLPRHVIKLPK